MTENAQDARRKAAWAYAKGKLKRSVRLDFDITWSNINKFWGLYTQKLLLLEIEDDPEQENPKNLEIWNLTWDRIKKLPDFTEMSLAELRDCYIPAAREWEKQSAQMAEPDYVDNLFFNPNKPWPDALQKYADEVMRDFVQKPKDERRQEYYHIKWPF